ncbi:hypothetical protein [Vulgatibacter sp.]|uniref:hypothetical protein n=1 Tax=Vulgatibacter sp. TaxID=1971226 RepID=UPI0035669A41
MKRRDPLLPTGDRGEVTRELTGRDANMGEADVGDAGNGVDYWGADLTGGLPRPIEDEPDRPDDIVPDRVERWPGQPADEDRELTAQPTERDTIDPADLP